MAVTVKHKWWALVILALSQFMVILDATIVNIALPSIQTDLRFSPEDLQWIVNGYTLAFGGFLLLGGRAADLFGRRKVFIGSLIVFGFASLAGGFAQDQTQLLVARGIQGLAAAFLSPGALSIVLSIFKEGKERNTALGVWAGIAAGGAAFGSLLGGVLTEYAGWEWVFFVNTPIAVFAALAALKLIPESRGADRKGFDLPGAILVTAGLMLLVYGLVETPNAGWDSSATWLRLGGAVGLLALFGINEARAKKPLMPFSIFKVRNVLAANLTMLPVATALFGMFFFVSLYMQQILGFSALKAGFSYLPITLAIFVVSGVMSQVIGKTGYKKPMIAGPIVMAIGLFMLSRLPVDGTYLGDLLPAFLVMSTGMGLIFVAATLAATSGVKDTESGLASALLNTSQQIGGSLGLAILATVSASTTAGLVTGGPPTPEALVEGFDRAFLVAAGIALIGAFVAAFRLKEKRADLKKPLSPAG